MAKYRKEFQLKKLEKGIQKEKRQFSLKQGLNRPGNSRFPKKMQKSTGIQGDVPSPMNPPPGCRFHTRCPERMPICSQRRPVSEDIGIFDVVSLFTNVQLSDTIEIILDELFDSIGQSKYLVELNCEINRSETKKLLKISNL